MVGPFFRLAMLSVGRQAAFRRTVMVHLLAMTAIAAVIFARGALGQALLGQFLLIAGIVEGALLVGWRLTQLPKSRALEFLLVSPLRPRSVFAAEALVGLSRLALVTLAGFPILAVLVLVDRLEAIDLGPLLLMPLTWGAITGLGLTVWAYEQLAVRRWGERVILCLIVLYLIVGVLAGERLREWLDWLFLDPDHPLGPKAYVHWFIWKGFEAIHHYSPFQIMQLWFQKPASRTIDDMLGLEAGALAVVGLLFWRAAGRLKGHFHDRHYSPIVDPMAGERAGRLWWWLKVTPWLGTGVGLMEVLQPTDEPTDQGPARPAGVPSGSRGIIGSQPLSWWAVRRVTEYSGRVNLWLAGGFGILYAAYTVAGAHWPDWLGRAVFQIADTAGGIPMLTTGLVVLAAAPAALQYGLWDSNAPDRCRRLELLLLTELDAQDYWEASTAAAWRRGRGYFYVALLLWGAGLAAGRMDAVQVGAALGASIILWGLFFALGFRAFSRGMQASGLGSLLTLGLPVVVIALAKAGWPVLAALLPPGSIYYATDGQPTFLWALGPILGGVATLIISRRALENCDAELRRWYEHNHGSQIAE